MTDPLTPRLRVKPLSEYATLRNGSLYNRSDTLRPAQLFTPLLTGPGHTMELMASFAFSASATTDEHKARSTPQPVWADRFVLSVLALSTGTHNSTLITANVSAPNNVTGNRVGVLSVERPLSTSRPEIAVNWSAPFELPAGAKTIDIRVFVDRSVVEVFAAGMAGVQAYRPPSTAYTMVHVMSARATTVSLEAWSMGCGWADSDTQANLLKSRPLIKTDDGFALTLNTQPQAEIADPVITHWPTGALHSTEYAVKVNGVAVDVGPFP